jgi:hypothetical protein
MLYLCYHPDDGGYFNHTTANEELARAMWEAYERERDLDETLFGPLRFHLVEPTGGHYPLRLHLARQPPTAVDADTVTETSVEFSWHETSAQTSPGTLNFVRRSFQLLKPTSTLVAMLSIGSGASLAPHVRAWQGNIRWTQPVVYLPKGRWELLIGPSASCDLYAPALASVVSVSYDSDKGGWEWLAPFCSPQPTCRDNGEFEFQQQGSEGAPSLALYGSRLPTPLSWAEVEEANRLPLYDIALVGCVLPLPRPHGYGTVPPLSPSKLNASSSSALRLPGGDWLYLDGRTNLPRLYSPNGPVTDQQLVRGQYAALSSSADADTPAGGCWQENEERLPRLFRGEFHFEPPLIQPLASGTLCGHLPDEIFPQYADSLLTPGRAPVKLKSNDGRNFKLVINQSARLPVIVIPPGSVLAFCYDPVPAKEIDLEPWSEFIVGAAHYCLRPAPNQPGTLPLLQPCPPRRFH